MIDGNKKIYDIQEIDDVFFNREKTLKNIFLETMPMNIFDVGANIGQSLIQFKNWFPTSTVYCFEPDPDTYHVLKSNNHKNVIYHNVGVGSKNKEKIFYQYSLSAMNSFLQIDKKSKVFKEKVHKKINEALENDENESYVQIITLDQYCQDNNIDKIDILKIDVQGYEKKVLKGARKLLKENDISVLIIEIIFDEIYGRGTSFYEIELRLIPKGYKLWDISHIYKDLTKNRTNWVDVIYVKKEIYESL